MEAALSEFISSVERALASLPSHFLGVIGVSYKTAPIESREKLAKRFTIEHIAQIAKQDATLSASEIVLLSTCNRIELYYYADKARVTDLLPGFFENEDQVYQLNGKQAVKHLFEVAAGLDSLVIGETQILAQVREASKESLELGLSSEVLSRLFAKAYESGKSARDNQKFSDGLNRSVSHAVLDLISKDYNGKRPNLLLIGSGKMIRLAVAAIDKARIGKVILASRKPPTGNLNADSFVGIDDVQKTIADSKIDIIITATSADDYIIRAEHLKEIEKPLLILDISVPRNVDPEVEKIVGITLLNLDDLKDKIQARDVSSQIQVVRRQLYQGVEEFSTWLTEYEEIAPLLSSLRKRAEAIRKEELENAFSRLPNLTHGQKLVVEKMTERLIRRFLHDPTIRIKQVSRIEGNEKARLYAEVVAELFSSDTSAVSK